MRFEILSAFLGATDAGAPGHLFYEFEDYWPVTGCQQDKACYDWKIAQKPGWSDTRAVNLRCEIGLGRCVCKTGFMDANEDPRDGCELEINERECGIYGACDDHMASQDCGINPNVKCMRAEPGAAGCCRCDMSTAWSIVDPTNDVNINGCKMQSEPSDCNDDQWIDDNGKCTVKSPSSWTIMVIAFVRLE